MRGVEEQQCHHVGVQVANATTTLKTLDSQMTQVSDALDVLTTQWTSG